jgi:DNA-binding NtrC family response regulator
VEQVDVRFLAATNRDPQLMIRDDGLREDLFYRLRGIEISLPLLDDRIEDIPLLAAHFAGEEAPGFTADAMEALMRAPWPGNVRQLRNVVQGAKAAAGEDLIRPDHLSLERTASLTVSRSDGVGPPRGATLREIERHAIVQALEDCAGNRTRAAKQLDIDRSTLRRKLQEYEID